MLEVGHKNLSGIISYKQDVYQEFFFFLENWSLKWDLAIIKS